VTGALVIAIASSQGSAPDGAVTFLGSYPNVNSRRDTDEGLTTLASRSLDVSGAERSGVESNPWITSGRQPRTQGEGRATPDYTATATPRLGALRLASFIHDRSVAEVARAGGSTPAAPESSGGMTLSGIYGSPARFNTLGLNLGGEPIAPDARGRVTRRACADARRGLAFNCAGVSERLVDSPSAQGVYRAGRAGLLRGSDLPRSETCRAARKALAFYFGKMASCLASVLPAGSCESSTLSVAASDAMSTGARTALNKRAKAEGARDCRSARRAVAWYQARWREWRERMGAGPLVLKTLERPRSCTRLRYLARLWRAKARVERLRFERWHRYHFAWREWLPAVWQRLGACETGYGKRPGNWHWDSGRYVSAFGIYRPAYADDAHQIGLLSWDETLGKLHRYPTPREQYRTALSHHRLHGGFSGWGCRGA